MRASVAHLIRLVADQVRQLIWSRTDSLDLLLERQDLAHQLLALLTRRKLGHLHQLLRVVPVIGVPVLAQRRVVSHNLGVGPHRDLALDLLIHLSVRAMNLLAHELLRLGVQFGLQFLSDLLALDHLGNLFVVLGPDGLELLLQLFLGRILLRNPGFCRLQLGLDLLGFGQLVQLQRPATALGQQMRGDVPREQDGLVLAELLLDLLRDVRLGHELGVEDFVLALRQVGDDLDEVLLVWEVLLLEVDAALLVQGGEVLLHLCG